MLRENLKMALISIRGAKLRSFLTMLGIIIGVGSVVAIMAAGAGLQSEITGQIDQLGAATLTITPGHAEKGRGGAGALGGGTSSLTTQDVAAIRGVAHVKGVAPVATVPAAVKVGSKLSPDAVVVATTTDLGNLSAGSSASASSVGLIQVATGHFFSAANQAVAGDAAARNLFGTSNAVGRQLLVGGQPFTIVGVLKAPSSSGLFGGGGGGTNSSVIIPFSAAQNLSSNLQISSIIVGVDNSTNANAAAGSIKQVLLKNHQGVENFSVLTQQDILDRANSILGVLTGAVAAIAAISLVVGGIGIMNIMLVSVAERTREIGIRKAIGASSRTVLTQFLIEAMVLSLLGGLLGLAVAFALTQGVARAVNFSPVITPGAIGLAFGVSVFVGVVFGLAPAIKAARMRPIQALRYE